MQASERGKEGMELLEELGQIEAFHRGTVNMHYRQCGKPHCVCTQEDHPGHGPQYTLTYKEKGKTITRNLPTMAAVQLARGQTEQHRRFVDWCKKWQRLNEGISEKHLEQVIAGETPEGDPSVKKKRRRPSSKRSGRRSKR